MLQLMQSPVLFDPNYKVRFDELGVGQPGYFERFRNTRWEDWAMGETIVEKRRNGGSWIRLPHAIKDPRVFRELIPPAGSREELRVILFVCP